MVVCKNGDCIWNTIYERNIAPKRYRRYKAERLTISEPQLATPITLEVLVRDAANLLTLD